MSKLSTRRAFIVQRLPHILIFMAVAAFYWLGLLDFLDLKLTELRYRLIERDASQNIVFVTMDAASLQELDTWPWPRSYHAKIVENLTNAGAGPIIFDVDFSARSDPREDLIFEEALAASTEKIVLPSFGQLAEQPNIVLSAPLARFAQYTETASANIVADSDGQLRQMSYTELWGEQPLATLFTKLMSAEQAVQQRSREPFYIDYGIDPDSITKVSYSDILLDRFDPGEIAGKSIIVGATAIELGDHVPVPVHGILPGAMVQILAYESAIQGRALTRISRGPILFGALILLLLSGPLFAGTGPGRAFVHLCFFTFASLLLTFVVQAVSPYILDAMPWLIALWLSFGVSLVSRINQQDLRLIAQSLAIRRRDRFMREVLDNNIDGVLLIDNEQIIRDYNRAAEQILGLSAERTIGTTLHDVSEHMQPFPGGGQLNEICQKPGGPHELKIRASDGHVRYIQINVSHTAVNQERIIHVSLRDITGERAAEGQAKEARDHLKAAIESIQEGFVLYDASDRMVLSNTKFRKLLFGNSAELRPGMTFTEITRACAEAGTIAGIDKEIEPWLQSRMAAHRRRNSVYEELFTSGAHFRVSEQTTSDGGTVVIYNDVTALKERETKLEQAVEREGLASRSKSEFLANMSHELRTPLNAIIGFSEIMANEMLGPIGNTNYKSYATDIVDSSQHLLSIINEILDVSKIEEGAYELDKTDVDVVSVIDSCIRMAKARTAKVSHSIIISAASTLPPLHADARAFKQIILNLLSNAIKFSPGGGEILITATHRPDGYFLISVADQGVGMAPEDISRAIELFGQVDSKLSREFDGTGLGLPLAQKLTELHGGNLQIASEPNVGTVVTLSFPPLRAAA